MNEREIFLSALEFEDPTARQAFLQSACAGNADLLAGIQELLASHEGASEFLKTPVVEQLADGAAEENAATIQFGDGSTEAQESDQSSNLNAIPTMAEEPEDVTDDAVLGYLQPSSNPDALGRLAHYEILEVLGRGAFGTVLKAFDEKLRREVAIKLMAPELAVTSPPRRRFLREARASAGIRHENVVNIHAVDDDPIPYFVMEYIPGQTLKQRLHEHGPLDLPDVLRLGQQIADGLAAAHAQQLIHRDVKPGNILLETSSNNHVKISDFGLARTADEASVTQSGMIAGTPMYMAPEQAFGHKLDHRADLFSLGSVLYEMITGRPPFRAPSTMAVLKRVTEDTPRPIPEIISETPKWMCDLVANLHQKNPDDRYGSAKEVADLLGKCLIELKQGRVPNVPNPQRPPNPAGAAPPQTPNASAAPRRLRRLLLMAAGVMLVLLMGLGLTEATGVTQLASTVIRLATGSGTLVIESNDPSVKITIDGGGKEITIRGGGIEELKLRPGDYKVAATKDGKPFKQELVTITRNGRKVVRISLESTGGGSADAAAKVPPGTPYLKKKLVGHPGTVFTVVFSPDGSLLASGGIGGVRVWNAQTGTLCYTLPVPGTARISAVAFSPDGKYLVTAPQSTAPISIWEASTGKPAGVLPKHAHGVFDLAFSPDGKTLLSCGWGSFVGVWDFAARRKLRDIPSPSKNWVRSVAVSNSGKIAFANDKLFIAEPGGAPIRTIEKEVALLSFSPDGKYLAGTTWKEGRVTVWEVHSAKEITSWRTHQGYAEGVAFSQEGNVLATSGSDGKVRLWDFKTKRQLGEFSHDHHVNEVSFSPDGNTLAAVGHDGAVTLWDVRAILALQKKKQVDSKRFRWPKGAPPPAIAPFNAKQAKQHQEAWAKYLGVPVEKDIVLGKNKEGKEVKLTLVFIPPGEFLMGSSDEERSQLLEEATAAGDLWAVRTIPNEGPQHLVRITKPFWLGRHEVTFGQFRMFVDKTGYKTDAEKDGKGGYGVVKNGWLQDPRFVWNGDHSFPRSDEHPVVFVSWTDAESFCSWASKELDEVELALPTEAQWEFACRAGTATPWCGGAAESDLRKHAWFAANSSKRLQPVGQLLPNGFGLYDMHGNVWEWCADRYAADYYVGSRINDPAGPPTGSTKVQRGGDWYYASQQCRSAFRHHGETRGARSVSLGFRVAAPLPDDVIQAKLTPVRD